MYSDPTENRHLREKTILKVVKIIAKKVENEIASSNPVSFVIAFKKLSFRQGSEKIMTFFFVQVFNLKIPTCRKLARLYKIHYLQVVCSESLEAFFGWALMIGENL